MPSYNPDKSAVKGIQERGRNKILKHMGGRGIKFDSTTNKGIKGLGKASAEGKYI
tara:strand:- start:602 stop:766 length:165 start_codon:yes stop_codon:yes gene_type:complete